MQANADTRPGAAALWMLGAMLIIGFIDNLIGGIAAEVGLWQFFVLRTAVALPVILLLPLAGLGALRVIRWPWVALRSLLAASAMLCYFGALGLMPIAQALAGLYTAPIFILLFGLAFGQGFGPWRALAVGMGFAGVLLVLQLGGGAVSLTLLLPVLGGAIYAAGAMVTRSHCAGESPVALLLGVMGLQGALSALVLIGMALMATTGTDYLTRGWVWPISPASWGVIVVQGLGSLAAVYGIVRAYQLAEPSLVSVIEYAVMVFGPLFALWLFGDRISIMQGCGIALIVAAGLVIAWRTRVAAAEVREVAGPGMVPDPMRADQKL